jgi:hypothetical protein
MRALFLVIGALCLAMPGAVLAATPAGTDRRGPDGFGNIPYGSSADDAVRLNHGNGTVVHNDGPPILTYSTNIQGMTFSVTQYYDKSGKAVDAIAVSTSTESTETCVARFNYVLSLLQTTYREPGSAPFQERTVSGEVSYGVLFEFDRSDGIEAKLTAAGPAASTGSSTGTASAGNGGSSATGQCSIRLHYLPPGWVGHF